jgi:hypothetical protein
MSGGYGRGYYGAEQLDPRAQRPRTSGWVKVALVVGVGAVVWLLWPRSKIHEPAVRDGDVPTPPPPPPALPEGPPQVAAPATALLSATSPRLDQAALARGYPSQEAYEDAVVASARQLQRDGATVTLAPHLQHLAPRLGSVT